MKLLKGILTLALIGIIAVSCKNTKTTSKDKEVVKTEVTKKKYNGERKKACCKKAKKSTDSIKERVTK